ncbi:MAG: BrnT family toxin [Kiritimatiellota bacterium]|nr:BrnT family toxin [Kiritimatiellota bacterium]
MNKPFVWDDSKNAWLIVERGVSFDEIVYYIMNGHLVDVILNENQDKYPGQRIFVVNCAGYIHLVPFDESENDIQLKTIVPSRKATKKYLKGKRDET